MTHADHATVMPTMVAVTESFDVQPVASWSTLAKSGSNKVTMRTTERQTLGARGDSASRGRRRSARSAAAPASSLRRAVLAP